MEERQDPWTEEQEEHWYVLDGEEVIRRLKSSDQGLSDEEAGRRLEQYGPNELVEEEPISAVVVFLQQFKNPLIYILILAVVVTASLGEFKDSAVILAVILINAIIGSWQELKAEKSIRALRSMVQPQARVIRQGREVEVPTESIVPGDIVLLTSGERVPADIRLLEAKELRIEEAALTGESLPSSKTALPLKERGLTAGDQENMAFAGTTVLSGRGRGMVVATGVFSLLGQIAERVRNVELTKTPLQQRFERFAKLLGLAVLGLAVVVFGLGFALGLPTLELFMTGVAMSVAIIPEGLPVVVTVTMAIGVSRMSRRHAIIRKLHAVETLGSTTIICSDKTGTLTKNEMTVRSIFDGHEVYQVTGTGYSPEGEVFPGKEDGSAVRPQQGEPLERALRIGLLCNESYLEEREGVYHVKGDPTEAALIVAALKAGLDRGALEEAFPQTGIIPYESERGYMATLHRTGDRTLVYLKGAPEKMLSICTLSLTQEECRMEDVLRASEEFARQGLRVLAVAWKEVPAEHATVADLTEELAAGVIFAGLFGIIDPPRQEVLQAVEECHRAGIRTVMITGDHAVTARSIAETLNIGDGRREVVTGQEIEAMDDAALQAASREASVFARVAPQHKLRIAQQFMQSGEIVAMTGDGVNDAPALKAAHIGVAMGRSGTEVAKEAAEMVLTDDNFASIVSAVEEGRVVFENIRKVTLYLIGGGFSILVALIGTMLLGLPLPLNPTQIIWLNFVTSALQDVSLAFERGEKGILQRPPRPLSEGILTPAVLRRIILVGLTGGICTLAIFWTSIASGASLEEARTLALTQLVAFQLVQVFCARSVTQSVFRMNHLQNPYLYLSITLAVSVHMAAVYLPSLEWIIRTVPLQAEQLLVLLAVALISLAVVEADKAWLRRRERTEEKTVTARSRPRSSNA
ncbi:MAG: cation-translocating P-type ATPase [Desulfovibrionales bacterium]